MTVIFCPRKLVYKPYSVILKLITCRIPVKFEQYARHIKKIRCWRYQPHHQKQALLQREN